MSDSQRNPAAQPLPGSVSDQNTEEAPGHDDGTAGHGAKPAGERGEHGSRGEAKEGSQSTGHPGSAG